MEIGNISTEFEIVLILSNEVKNLSYAPHILYEAIQDSICFAMRFHTARISVFRNEK